MLISAGLGDGEAGESDVALLGRALVAGVSASPHRDFGLNPTATLP